MHRENLKLSEIKINVSFIHLRTIIYLSPLPQTPPPHTARQPWVGRYLPTVEASRSHSDTPQSVELLWRVISPKQRPLFWQHTALTTDRHPCNRQDSNPQCRQVSGRIPTP